MEQRKRVLLFVDDDEDDFLLLKDLFTECRPDVEIRWMKDGEMALDYLLKRGQFASESTLRPSLILLDLNMPKLNGREVLREIRNNPALNYIPVAVLTNSINKDEALDAYRLGVNSFIRKPSGYKELTEFVRVLSKYWFDYSTLL